MMIPKKIHYCWFGRGEMSLLMKKCIKSWKKYCPDYEIIEWNEDNFDVGSTVWTKQAYEAKKYTFVADYVRLKALSEQGGVYLDTDVELIKPIDRFLLHTAFSGFECADRIQTGIMGAVAAHPAVVRWLAHYRDLPYIIDGKPTMEPNVLFITNDLVSRGLILNDTMQCVDDVVIYPQTYFCPLSIISIEQKITDNTIVIHRFTSTWRTEKARRDFARLRRHQRKWHKALVWLRYLPNRAARKVCGEARIDKLKSRVKR